MVANKHNGVITIRKVTQVCYLMFVGSLRYMKFSSCVCYKLDVHDKIKLGNNFI
jgi:hypothetical protein